jgi:hypothetical protein
MGSIDLVRTFEVGTNRRVWLAALVVDNRLEASVDEVPVRGALVEGRSIARATRILRSKSRRARHIRVGALDLGLYVIGVHSTVLTGDRLGPICLIGLIWDGRMGRICVWGSFSLCRQLSIGRWLHKVRI